MTNYFKNNRSKYKAA